MSFLSAVCVCVCLFCIKAMFPMCWPLHLLHCSGFLCHATAYCTVQLVSDAVSQCFHLLFSQLCCCMVSESFTYRDLQKGPERPENLKALTNWHFLVDINFFLIISIIIPFVSPLCHSCSVLHPDLRFQISINPFCLLGLVSEMWWRLCLTELQMT